MKKLNLDGIKEYKELIEKLQHLSSGDIDYSLYGSAQCAQLYMKIKSLTKFYTETERDVYQYILNYIKEHFTEIINYVVNKINIEISENINIIEKEINELKESL